MAFFKKNSGDGERKTTVSNKWLKWSLGEAGIRSAGHTLGKIVGVTATTLTQTFWSAGIVGLVQVVIATLLLKRHRERFFSTWYEVGGSLWFGFNALVLTLLVFATFFFGGDLGVRSVIVVLSIVPGAFIDRIFFNNRLVWRQWLGVAVGCLAGWVVVGRPSLSLIATLPLWVWLSFATALFLAISQGITQGIKNINPLRKNFWGGTVSLLALPLALVIPSLNQVVWWNETIITLTWLSAIIGVNVILLWTVNVLAYRDGANIAIKKLVALGGNLVINMLIGGVLFGEALTGGKVVGVALFLLAFMLMDRGTWEYLMRRVS